DGARTSLTIVAILCSVLIVAIPVGVWLLLRMLGGKVRISQSGLEAKGLYGSITFEFSEVARVGLLEVPIIARGMGGALVRQRVGGDKAIHLVVRTHAGKTKKFIASSYEDFQEIIREVTERTGKPLETLSTGLIGVKWPGDG